jgi:Skp family chaperone for outer membrane proteins
MSDNKNGMLIAGAIFLGFIIVAAVLFYTLKGGPNDKVAIVDMSKVMEQSQIGKKIKKDVETKGKELQAKSQLAKSDAEKSQISYEFEKFKNEKLQDFTEKVKKITADTAKRKGITAVSRPDLYIYCEEDLTDEVVKQLDK